ncbi:hypothetical protein FACS189494_11920 [Spirochaetia bacterium]|nr:hypothetical protein FACS189494_11920 [Spirochaetia bacterium]
MKNYIIAYLIFFFIITSLSNCATKGSVPAEETFGPIHLATDWMESVKELPEIQELMKGKTYLSPENLEKLKTGYAI